jgi:hypothetical protein
MLGAVQFQRPCAAFFAHSAGGGGEWGGLLGFHNYLIILQTTVVCQLGSPNAKPTDCAILSGKASGVSVQMVIQDPIPFLILLGLILLLSVWAWRWFKDR